MGAAASVHSESVVVLGPPSETEVVVETLAACGRAVRVVGSLDELASLVAGGELGTAIVAAELVTADIDRFLVLVGRQPPWSDVPVTLIASPEHLEAADLARLERGNVTVLERPLRLPTLRSLLTSALRARRRQYEVRDLLARSDEESRRKDQFLAMMGHELRNPLSVITSAVQVLERTNDPATAARNRAAIQRQSRHLARIVDDLLDVSRVTVGKIDLVTHVLDLRLVASRCVQDLQPAAQARDQTLSCQTPADEVAIRGDAVRLEQILSNLVGNALKYTPDGGHIEVTVEQGGGEGVLRVRDSGIGIDEELLPRIFDLFTQADHSLVRTGGGLGLGLTLVKHLAQLHGGSVEALSAGPGRGAEFVVRLPIVARPPDEAERPPEPPVDHPAFHRAFHRAFRIVLLEDNQDARETLEEMLRMEGHEVDGAGDGLVGAQLIVRQRPDVALVDIGLPTLDGYEVARFVRSRVGNDVSLVALTGYGQPHERQRAFDAGFDHHLVKPIDGRRLARILAGLRSASRPDGVKREATTK